MNKYKLSVFLVSVIILSNSFAFADTIEGKSLVNFIKGSDHENVNSITGFYDGYISGVADSTVNAKWCPSQQVNSSQLQKTVINYYKNNSKSSDLDSLSAKELILTALADAHPCNK